MLLFLLAIVVRVLALWLHPGAPIEMEGAEYARIAENLRDGNGLVGIRGYPVPAFSPLYPLLIAACSYVYPSFEAAGVSISIIAGAALVFPLRAIASLLYTPRAGIIAALLAAFMPLQVKLSTQVFSEPLFVTLIMTGIFCTLRAVKAWEEQGARAWDFRWSVGAGAFFFAAYLTRPEGVAFAVIAFALLLLRIRLATQAAVLFASFALLLLPYVLEQRAHTGTFQLEGKSAVNYAVGQRLAQGMTYWRAANEVSDDLKEIGGEIIPPSVTLPKPTPREGLLFIVEATRAHFWTMVRILTGRVCGGIVLSGLTVWGLVIGLRSRERLWPHAALLSFLAAEILVLGSVWHFWDRYDAVLAAFLIPWAAGGVNDAGQRFQGNKRIPNGALIAGALVALMFATSYVSQAREKVSSVERDAGLWIARHDAAARGKITMETRDQVAYYSDTAWRPLPYASERTALRYLLHVRPRYVVLSATELQTRPYLAQWFAHGIPSYAFVRVLVLHPGQPDELRLYRYRAQEG